MKKLKITANIDYVEGDYTLEQLGLTENATETEIDEKVSDLVNEHLSWGWEVYEK